MQALAKAGSKDDNERVIGTLIQAGVLSLDFGFTAYVANVYLKRSQIGMQGDLLQVVLHVASRRNCQVLSHRHGQEYQAITTKRQVDY